MIPSSFLNQISAPTSNGLEINKPPRMLNRGFMVN